MKIKAIRTIKEEIAALDKDRKSSHKDLVEDFMRDLGMKEKSAEAIALRIVQCKRKL